MNKILYSIVTALFLSVILFLLPRLLFKGDARWTYQNDTARMDVKFSGHLKNGHVSAQGTNLRAAQPVWLSSESYQGTVIEFPISYRTKTYQINLSPKADEWGEDAALVIEFKGKDFQHRGKRQAAWVSFRNITLNGQSVAGEKVVWHNKPFALKYPLHPSLGISLTFDVCKPFATSDISFKNLLVIFVVFCSLFCLCFTSLKRIAGHVLTFTNQKDIVQILSDSYLHIEPVYRRSFWIIFGILCFAFGFHTIQFMWGNHDWDFLERTHQWLERTSEGRYMNLALRIPLSDGIYLPLIYDLITFVASAINAVLLCKYWRLKKRVIYFVLCGLVLTAQPFTLSMMYFVNMIPESFIGVTCALVALLLSEKVVTKGGYIVRMLIYSLLSIVLINLALAMYPVLLNTIAVTFFGRLLVQSFDWDGSRRQLKSCMRPFIISAAHIIFGIVLYKLIITCVFSTGHTYNVQMLPLEQIPERLGVLFKQCFHQLYEYKYPFISQWILWGFGGFTAILVLYVCCTGNPWQKVIRLVLLIGTLFATQTSMVVAKVHIIDGRIELYGLVFFETLVTAMVVTRFRKLHNLSVITGACIIFASVLQDLNALRVWKLGFDAERMLWNRILARLETQKDFDPAGKYDVVTIGYPIAMRPRYYAGVMGANFTNVTSPMLGSYEQVSDPFRPHEFYYSSHFRDKHFTLAHRNNPDYIARLKQLYQAGILHRAEVWPKPNGLIVWRDIILFVTDGRELDNYKKRFERELGRK